jgi:serralysin
MSTIYGTKGRDTLTGTEGDDDIYGDGGSDKLYGLGGDDHLSGGRGADYLNGGAGDDTLLATGAHTTLVGGEGVDLLRSNGAGHTRYVFAEGDSGDTLETADHITKFISKGASRDIVDLRQIDADASTRHNDAFSFIGTAAFSGHAGELRYEYMRDEAGHVVRAVEGDTNGDGHADFMIRIDGNPMLSEQNFLL